MAKKIIILIITGILILLFSIACASGQSGPSSQAPSFSLTDMTGSQIKLSLTTRDRKQSSCCLPAIAPAV